MCLYPERIRNRAYIPNKKNGGIIPPVIHTGTLWTVKKCEQCIECRTQKAREWQIRLQEHITEHKNGKLIVLTFNNESIKEIGNQFIEKYDKEIKKKIWIQIKDLRGYAKDNQIAIYAMRRFNERYRKKYKKAINHWTVTELGHNGTENIHLHGILFTDTSYEELRRLWKYGYIWPRPHQENKCYVNAKTINYNIKYVHKLDKDHYLYKSKILASPGIGSIYCKRIKGNVQRNKFNYEKTDETYKTSSGHTINLPAYYRKKIYDDEEREILWIQQIEKGEVWIRGEKAETYKQIWSLREWHRRINRELGYGDTSKDWEKWDKEEEKREELYKKRTQ